MKPNIKRMQAINAPDTASVQRNVVLRVNSGRRTKNKAFTTYAVNHRLLVWRVDLSPQAAHVHVNEIAPRYKFVVPDFLEQHGAGQHLILSAHHVFEQAKLPWQQIDRAVAACRRARQQIELKWPDAQYRAGIFGGASQQRFDPGNQFLDREWLGQIVVSASTQSTY